MDPSELFSVYILLVPSKQVPACSPEIEARTAVLYGKCKSHRNLFTSTIELPFHH